LRGEFVRAIALVIPTVVIPREGGGIQYAAAFRFNHHRLWNTGSSAFADDDS
jgi:hypothetical protein